MPNKKYNGISKEHPLYGTFHLMHQRCRDKNRENYKYYGGRGIKVCERWSVADGFKNFIADMGERPHKHQLDRVNVDKDYEPGNCRWVTKYEQMANTRATKIFPGVTWSKAMKKYRVRIKVNRKEVRLGYFDKVEDAIAARIEGQKLYL